MDGEGRQAVAKTIARKEVKPAMPQVPAFHWERDKEKYHNNSKCGPGSEIPPQHRIPGTGGKKLCDNCARLNAEGK